MAKNIKIFQNIEFLIWIGQFKLKFSLPKSTTVSGLLNIVKGYQQLHLQYGPQGGYFIGLGSAQNSPLIDYWLSQPHLDFSRFPKHLALKSIYASQRRINRLSTNQFVFLACLGSGAYGEVYLVRNRISGAVLALKRVSKEQLKHKNIINLFQQKKIMVELGLNNHTVYLHGCFQSQNHFNFIMDYFPGGQLYLHLLQQKLTMQHIRIYFCQILLAIQFLHKKKILYRDLKPENIFVDVMGHLFIGDFGLSKCEFNQQDFAYSMCGSQQYMAPQVLQNLSYNLAADFYSIGALLYQLLTGLPPHYNQKQQRLNLIKNMHLDLNKATNDQHLKNLLFNLLHPDPAQRITNFQQIKNSPWLSDVDWKRIQSKKDLLPFAPQPSKKMLYIAKQFLECQFHIQDLNNFYQDQYLPNEISDAFYFVKSQSRKLFGLQEQVIPFKIKNKQSKGISKDKKIDKPKKTNLSVALFDKDDTAFQSICSSDSSNLRSNKENIQVGLRKQQSRKNIVLNKQTSMVNIPKHTPTNKPVKQHKILLTSHNTSDCSSKNSQASSRHHTQVRNSSRLKQTNKQAKSRPQSKQKSGLSKDKGLRDTSIGKNSSLGKTNLGKQVNMKKKQQKKVLPTCSFKIKLS